MQHNFEGLDRPGGVSRVGLLRPLASRDFRFLWSGMTASLIGDGVFLVAIAWTAFSLWNTPAALSVVGIAMTVPTIACLLFGGVISDRFDRRRILLISDLGRALVVGLLAALAFTGRLDFVLLTAPPSSRPPSSRSSRRSCGPASSPRRTPSTSSSARSLSG
jgi:DHA3 family tetracycline resistance protein-like MFS transporter